MTATNSKTRAEPKDEELLEAWRSGDAEAGDALLARYFDSICRFFRRKLGDDVHDLIQQTFLDCVEGRDRIQSGNVRAYLFGIARNRLSTWLRAQSRRGVDVDLSVNSIADIQTRPSQRIARSREEERLLAAMRHIPIDQQIALELTYWEGLSAPEVAAVLDVPANTIRSRLARARAALRTALSTLDTH